MNSKATVSRDGVKRFTVRITHRIGYDDLVAVTVYWLAEQEDEEARPSKTAVMRLLQERLTLGGFESLAYVGDHIDTTRFEALTQAALPIVSDLWPELAEEKEIPPVQPHQFVPPTAA